MKRISTWLMSGGSFIALCVVLREPSALKAEDGEPVLDGDNQVVRESFADAMADRAIWWIIAVVLVGAGLAIWYGLGDERRRKTFVPTTTFVFGVLGAAVASLWVFNYGHYAFADGEFIAEPGRTVAASTKVPWTVMWLLLVASFGLGRAVTNAGKSFSS